MTQYIRNQNSYRVTDSAGFEVHNKLPTGTYIIERDMEGNFYLNRISNFKNPDRIYGKTTHYAERIIQTYLNREPSTGVMLAGEKGSGKSLLAKMLSVEAANRGIITVVINRPWVGDAFNKLIQDIDQPAVVLFDEFEKVYDSEEQEKMLTLFDGMFPTKKLFVLTCNDKWRVDKHMRNRPGRIYYMLDFKGLEPDFIEEYCHENLHNKENITGLVRISSLFSDFNFDMLKAMVEEMNRYNETAHDVMHMLNTKPEYSENITYDVTATLSGVPIEADDLSDKVWRGNPISNNINISYYDRTDADEEEHGWENIQMTPDCLQVSNSVDGKFVFKNGEACIVLTRKKVEMFDYSQLF